MRTWSSISIALSVSAEESACECCSSTSSIWCPTLRIGFSAARGFWKIIDISGPRGLRIWSSPAARMSRPVKCMAPSAICPARSRMRMTAYDVTDLPEPDSPTMPTVSPFAMVTLTCCTALTMPRRVGNSTVRALTSRSGTDSVMTRSRAALPIDDVTQAVAQEGKAEHGDHQRGAAEERHPPFARHHEGRALRHHDPPLLRGRAHAQADEGEAGGVEDGVAHGERHLHHHDRHDVGQHLAEHDAEFAVAGEPRRLH